MLKTKHFSSTASFSTLSSLLTLFSKFFSSFLRSTCSLSVSHKYLALEEVYLPFRAAVPNNPTLRNPTASRSIAIYGVFTLFDVPFQALVRRPHLSWNTLDYNSETLSASDFHFELLPVHSPLLRQSLLVSFPPLTDMLKFSGCSCLISGAVWRYIYLMIPLMRINIHKWDHN